MCRLTELSNLEGTSPYWPQPVGGPAFVQRSHGDWDDSSDERMWLIADCGPIQLISGVNQFTSGSGNVSNVNVRFNCYTWKFCYIDL